MYNNHYYYSSCLTSRNRNEKIFPISSSLLKFVQRYSEPTSGFVSLGLNSRPSSRENSRAKTPPELRRLLFSSSRGERLRCFFSLRGPPRGLPLFLRVNLAVDFEPTRDICCAIYCALRACYRVCGLVESLNTPRKTRGFTDSPVQARRILVANKYTRFLTLSLFTVDSSFLAL